MLDGLIRELADIGYSVSVSAHHPGYMASLSQVDEDGEIVGVSRWATGGTVTEAIVKARAAVMEISQ